MNAVRCSGCTETDAVCAITSPNRRPLGPDRILIAPTPSTCNEKSVDRLGFTRTRLEPSRKMKRKTIRDPGLRLFRLIRVCAALTATILGPTSPSRAGGGATKDRTCTRNKRAVGSRRMRREDRIVEHLPSHGRRQASADTRFAAFLSLRREASFTVALFFGG